MSYGRLKMGILSRLEIVPPYPHLYGGSILPPKTPKISENIAKTHFKKRELDYLIDIAKITNAPIRVLHINEGGDLSEEQLNYKSLLEEYFDVLEFSFHFLESKNINEGVELFIQSRDSGMVAFINKKHTFFSTLFSKPLVKELGLNAKIPILALHDFRN